MALSKSKGLLIAVGIVLVLAVLAGVAILAVGDAIHRNAVASPFEDPHAANVLIDEIHASASLGTTRLIDVGPAGEILVTFQRDVGGWLDGDTEAGVAIVHRDGTLEIVTVKPSEINAYLSAKISATHVIVPAANVSGDWGFWNRETAESTFVSNAIEHDGGELVGDVEVDFIAIGGTAWTQSNGETSSHLVSFSADRSTRVHGSLGDRALGLSRDGCASTSTMMGVRAFAPADGDVASPLTYQLLELPDDSLGAVRFGVPVLRQATAENLHLSDSAVCGEEFLGTLRLSTDGSVVPGSLVAFSPEVASTDLLLSDDDGAVGFAFHVTANPRWVAASLVPERTSGASLLFDRETHTAYGFPASVYCESILIRGSVVAWSEPAFSGYSWSTNGPRVHITCETHTALLPE